MNVIVENVLNTLAGQGEKIGWSDKKSGCRYFRADVSRSLLQGWIVMNILQEVFVNGNRYVMVNKFWIL